MSRLLEHIMEQLFYYHNATDMPLSLLDPEGTVLQSFSGSGVYCELVREACEKRAFCSRLHAEGCRQAAVLKDAYIFSCPAGLLHFAVPVLAGETLLYTILAGPVAVEYPDIAVVDNLIQQCGCSLNYRKRLYGALSSVSIVEPVRLQYMSRLLYCLMQNLSNPIIPIGKQGDSVTNTEQRNEPLMRAEQTAEIQTRGERTGEIPTRGGKPDDAALWGIGGETPTETLPTPRRRPPILENALRYIDTHYAENVRLDEVARHIGLNPSYFSTIFKKEMQISFSQYIMKKKIEEACRLLKTTNYSLVEISNELGFDNQSYFSRSFKKHMGLSPNQFRHDRSADGGRRPPQS